MKCHFSRKVHFRTKLMTTLRVQELGMRQTEQWCRVDEFLGTYGQVRPDRGLGRVRLDRGLSGLRLSVSISDKRTKWRNGLLRLQNAPSEAAKKKGGRIYHIFCSHPGHFSALPSLIESRHDSAVTHWTESIGPGQRKPESIPKGPGN